MRCCSSRLPLLALVPVLMLAGVVLACSDEPDEPRGTSTAAGTLATATSTSESVVTPSITNGEATPTPRAPSPTPRAEGTAALEYKGYEIIGDFAYTPAIDFPEDLLIVVETGCDRCDGPTESLYRVWRNNGETHAALLIDSKISGAENAYITSFAMRPDLSDMVVTVCTECGGGTPFLESPVVLYRSLDGGSTWREIDVTLPGAPVFARAITDEGIVLSGTDELLFYWRGDAIQPPAGGSELALDSRHAGALRWLSDDGSTVLDSAGVPLSIVEPGSVISGVALDGADGSRAVTGWAIGYVAGPFEGWTATRIGPDGRLIGFRTANYVAPVSVLANGNVLGVLSGDDDRDGGLVGYIDSLKGELRPFGGPMLEPPFGDGERPTGRNTLHAAVSGPFLRVTSGINCLPIRATTDVQSRELTCAADGTLVYDRRGSATVGGLQWRRVALLDGREGYAVSTFLSDE